MNDSGRRPFPAGGKTWAELRGMLRTMSEGDIDWQGGRTPLFVFFNDEDTHQIGRDAYFESFTENALGGRRAFFGIGKMEQDVLDYSLSLLRAPEGAAGAFTTGGSESITLAVKAARDAHRAVRPGVNGERLNIVMPVTAHAAFDKAADLMDIELRRGGLGDNRRADVAQLEALIDDNTIMLVGSAPCYPHGVIDPITAIGALAERHGLWLHVDACVGGWLAPFFRRIGRPIAEFDFTIPAVRSISADPHKFGFCPKPASTVLFRNREDMERAKFIADAWPAGVYQTATLAGTRPAGAVAGAWAVINHLGYSGYEAAARAIAAMTDAYVADLSAIEGVALWAKPDLSIVNFGSDMFDIYAVAEGMSRRGWLPALTRRPKGMHLMMSRLHDPAREGFIRDLKASIAEVVKGSATGTPMKATY